MKTPKPTDDIATARRPRKRKWLRIVVVAIAVLVAGLATYRYLTAKPENPSAILANTLNIDPATPDRYLQQMRATNLAILGRQDLVAKARLDSLVERKPDPTAIEAEIKFFRWKDVLPEIAAENQVVMIAENHMSTVTRDWISETLPLFHEAGFTHYCAEAIAESTWALRFRGGANHQTGVYTADPRFGSIIRRALSLNMAVSGYDFRPFGHDTRENYAAEAIKEIAKISGNRIVVHAGHGHVVKYVAENESSMMAARFWEKSGIEPYTIYQITELHDADTRDFLLAQLKLQLGYDYKPVEAFVWQPQFETIKELRKANFDLPMVDMIVLHPPSTVKGPDSRLPTAGHQKQLNGTWVRKQWPVVISVYGEGDSIDVIPLDQVLLMDGESTFNLWVPDDSGYILRAFDANGQLEVTSDRQAERWILK